jgi:hypothetical protein
MANLSETRTVREAAPAYDRARPVQGAIGALPISGFHRTAPKAPASEQAARQQPGRHGSMASLADSPAPLTADYASPEGATISALTYLGTMAATRAAVASGRTPAALSSSGHHAAHPREPLARGGLSYWVRAPSEANEHTAAVVLREDSGADMQIHEFQGGAL